MIKNDTPRGFRPGLGVIGSVFVVLIWYPLKRLMKKDKPAAATTQGCSQESWGL